MELLKEDQYPEWDAFVREAKGGTVFHTSWYLRAFTDHLQIHVQRDAEGKIEAGMALTPVWFLGTRATRRTPLTPYNGPLIRHSRKKLYADRVSDEKHLVLRLLAESPRLGMYDYLLPPEWTDMMPFLWNGYDVWVRYTFQIPPAPLEVWRAEMRSEDRRYLKKAGEVLEAIQGRVETTEAVEECWDLLAYTEDAKQFSTFLDVRILADWWRAVRSRKAGAFYVVREGNGRPVCVSILLKDHRCGYYLASGIRPDTRHGPMSLLSRLLVDRMIRDTHADGLTFDFEGSVLPGVEHFFRGWGGRYLVKHRTIKIRTLWTYAAWSLHNYWTGHRKK